MAARPGTARRGGGLVADPAHQPGGHGLLGRAERGDLGVADQRTGVGIVDRARVVDRGQASSGMVAIAVVTDDFFTNSRRPSRRRP